MAKVRFENRHSFWRKWAITRQVIVNLNRWMIICGLANVMRNRLRFQKHYYHIHQWCGDTSKCRFESEKTKSFDIGFPLLNLNPPKPILAIIVPSTHEKPTTSIQRFDHISCFFLFCPQLHDSQLSRHLNAYLQIVAHTLVGRILEGLV